MLKLILFVLTLSTFNGIVMSTTTSLCGSPDLPFMANSKSGTKGHYEEGETFAIDCIAGSYIAVANQSTNLITCHHGQWTPGIGRCSQLLMVSPEGQYSFIASSESHQLTSDMDKLEMQRLTDGDPQTCLMVSNASSYQFRFDQAQLISHLALVVTNNVASNLISVWTIDECTIERHAHPSSMPLLLLIFRCPTNRKTTNLTINLTTPNSSLDLLNICDMDIFAVHTNCGQPSRPLYASVQLLTIQNDAKIAQYNCAQHYQLMGGNHVRVCRDDGYWHPRRAPTCTPPVTCDLSESDLKEGNFTYTYVDLDWHGRAVPDLTWRRFECANTSLTMPLVAGQRCLENGTWSNSDLTLLPECVMRMDFHVRYGPKRLIVIYVLACATICFILVAIVCARMYKKLSALERKLVEARSKSGKVLPE